MKKVLGIVLAVMLAVALVGCSGGNTQSGNGSGASTSTDTASTDTAETMDEPITVVSREDGSGTRGAFVELFGIESDDGVDLTTQMAEITNSTSVMMSTVAGNTSAIGYISLGSLNESVKALKIDGAEASAENVKAGTYKVARPFLIVTKEGLSDVAADFISYIMSTDGQAIVEENGYISNGAEAAYTSAGLSGKIVVAGSSSVTPVMEKLEEAYIALNPNVEIELQQSDSTTGITSTIDGVCDIGMASRELKDSEASSGLTPTTIATDGIAVIVNNDSPVDDLTSDQVKDIFMGNITNWSELSN